VSIGGLDAAPSHKALMQVKKQSRSATVRALGKPVRLRDKDHRKFVLRQPCLVCGRVPSDPHHLTFTQPRALGRRVSDEFTVPVCRVHHRELHRSGDEMVWWQKLNIDPLPFALRLWQQTRLNGERTPTSEGVTQVQSAKTGPVSSNRLLKNSSVIVGNNRIGNGHGLNRSCVTGLFLESILRMAALENSFSAPC